MAETWNRLDWRFLVKERIARIAKLFFFFTICLDVKFFHHRILYYTLYTIRVSFTAEYYTLAKGDT